MPLMVDYEMPVFGTGIVFVASLNATVPPGDMPFDPNVAPTIVPRLTDAAFLRAASTLAHMGLISGSTLAFLREAQKLTQADAAALCGVDTPTLQAFESGALRVTRDAWMTLADRACTLDSRGLNPYLAFCPVDLRPRRIRIVVDVTGPVINFTSVPCPCPC